MSNEETQEKKQETASDKSGNSTNSENTGAQEKDRDTIPAVEEAKKAALDIKRENDRREKLLAEEKKVLDRKESLNALGGGSPAGEEPTKPTLTDAEKASRDRIKAVGLSGGAQWAKNMDKEDAN